MISSFKMLSLLFYSFFYKGILVGGKGKMPEAVQRVIGNVHTKSQKEGHIFYPDTTIHWKFGTGMSILVLWLTYMLAGGIDGWKTTWKFFIQDGDWGLPVMLLCFMLFLLYYSAYTLMIAPWWVGKHPQKYFIYIGKDGIIKKNLLVTAYIPWQIVTGAKHHQGIVSGGTGFRYIDVYINKHDILAPRLSTSHGSMFFFVDIAQYTSDAMSNMAMLINDHIQH